MKQKNCMILVVISSLLVNAHSQNIQIKNSFHLPKVVNVNFYVSENSKPKVDDIGTGKIINMSCEVHYDFDDSTTQILLSGIDSIYDATDDLIGDCYNSNNLYDSYLLFHHEDNTKTKVVFLCKDYKKGLVSIGDTRFYLVFKN